MKVFETLARFTTPAGQELTFHRRDGDYYVYLDGEELMATRSPDSERALAEFACADLGAKPRVLIGGLGLGYTLQAALAVLPGDAEVVVAEVFACVIEWNRTFLPDLQGGALTESTHEHSACRCVGRDPSRRTVEFDSARRRQRTRGLVRADEPAAL